jgi:heavy metal sensor kinase
MFSNQTSKIHGTVAFRLTAWSLVLFALISLVVMGLAQARVRYILHQRTEEDLQEDLLELKAHYLAQGAAALQADFDRESNSTGTEEIFLVLLSAAGDLQISSSLAEWKGLVLPPEGARDLPAGEIHFVTQRHPMLDEKMSMSSLRLASGQILCVGRTLEEESDLMEIFNGVLVLALLGMLASGGLMSWLVLRRAMAGVQRVTNTAVQINRDHLGDRVRIGHEGEEIEDLTVAFNGMLDRIDALVRNLREVTGNLAHDLRRPLTRLRGIAETTLTMKAQPDDLRELAATVVEEADSLIKMLNTMLEIAETESGMARILDKTLDAGQFVRKACDLFQPAAEDRGIQMECAVGPDELILRGDLARLQRVMANLLDNAIKYTPPGGSIRVEATAVADRVAIRVADTGLGIEAADLPRIFERYYRGDKSRTQEGSGLGLSLCQSIVRAHGGEIQVDSTPGKGSTFTVLLPRR